MSVPRLENTQELSFDVLPASYAQRQLWLLQEMNPESRAYNVGAALRLQGRLDAAALGKAILTVVRRHEVLRTSFALENNEPVQLIADPPDNSESLMRFVDLSDFNEREKIKRLKSVQSAVGNHKFNLASGNLFITQLIRLGAEEHVFFLVMHHIVSDGWSVAVLVNELAEAYACLAAKRPVQLPALPIQYGDYAAWQRQQLDGGKLDAQLSYWIDQLKDAPVLLDLPGDRPRPPVQSFRGAQLKFSVPLESGRKLLMLGAKEHATPFMTLLAAFAVLLYRYTGQSDFLIGTPIANRSRKETQGLIGCFVNALVIRARCAGTLRFRDFLRDVRETSLAAFEHHQFPFELLVRHLGISPEPSHNPAFQVMFLLQNNERPEVGIPGLKISEYEMASSISRFDLSLMMEEEGPSFAAVVEYSSDLFEPETIVRFTHHLLRVLERIGSSPDSAIGHIPYLSGQEIEQMLGWNATERQYDKALLVHEMVAAHASSNPHAEAVSCGGRSMTFGELNSRANRLAQRLLQAGTRPDDLVGICCERSSAWVVGLLAILKAGAGYVPLDPRYPPDRLQFMIEDSSPRAILAQNRFSGLLGASERIFLLEDEDDLSSFGESGECPAGRANSQTACYIVYTSGSTGKPKGVVLDHGGLLNLIHWHQRTYGITPADRGSQIARMGFDASAWELWSCLTAGASIHIIDEETRLSAKAIQAFFLDHDITIAFLPPVLAEAALNLSWPAEAKLRILLSGSDRLVARPREGLPFRYWNHYGPTETTVIVTAGEVFPCEGANLPPTIGHPLDNSQIFLLDENLLQVPILRTAELYAAGDALARGYLNRPDLTAGKFIPNPFSQEPGARMYRTGDWGRFRADGQIEFLGRNDEQVKLRGFRIELGEIESILTQAPTLKNAAVALKTNAMGEKRLVAYLVGRSEELSVPAIKALLAARLPDFMVPSAFVVMNDLPISPNGKVDRGQLPAPAEQAPTEQQGETYVWTRESAKAVLAIWRQVLQVADIGPHANFFDLGGHSLAIVRVQELLKERMKLQVPVVELFRRPTISDLAAYVEQELAAIAEPKEESTRNAMRGKSRAEQRLRMRAGRSAREAASAQRREQH